MKFSYLLKQQYLLEDIDLPLGQPGVFLLAGQESLNLSILTGILGRLFPIPKDEIEWETIAALVESYTGNVIISDGQLPVDVTYVGQDPDRHVLFSTVEEEMIVSLSLSSNVNNIIEKHLAAFGLNPSFVNRHIATLSGGERMKVVLAIAFAKKANNYVLHGVLPWLDAQGRKLLLSQVLALQAKGVNFIFCEHEIEELLSIVNAIYVFDGRTVSKANKEQFIGDYFARQKNIGVVFNVDSNLLEQKKVILEFQKVLLSKHPYFEGKGNNFLLNEVSFALHHGGNYFVIGDNGAGKSTLAELIFRVFSPEKGEIFFDGKPLHKYSRSELVKFICYLAQFPEQQITFSTIREYKKEIASNKNDLALFLLDKYLQLDDSFPVASLSFCQLKVLCLSFFVNKQTKLIILDEPTWGIDYASQKMILNLLRDIRASLDITMFIISHNESLIRSLAGKVFKIENGNVIGIE